MAAGGSPASRLHQTLRRSIVQCRTWLNGLPPVWSVFWVTPPGGQAGESRWFTITPERPGLQVQQKGQAPQAVAGWQREAALPHACIRRCGGVSFSAEPG
ncbi:hypothetical protein BHS30_28355 [Klebsiella pneumoniae]|nr:hypothetical protein BHS30_28355 [Klebsiella pneumoniae]